MGGRWTRKAQTGPCPPRPRAVTDRRRLKAIGKWGREETSGVRGTSGAPREGAGASRWHCGMVCGGGGAGSEVGVRQKQGCGLREWRWDGATSPAPPEDNAVAGGACPDTCNPPTRAVSKGALRESWSCEPADRVAPYPPPFTRKGQGCARKGGPRGACPPRGRSGRRGRVQSCQPCFDPKLMFPRYVQYQRPNRHR